MRGVVGFGEARSSQVRADFAGRFGWYSKIQVGSCSTSAGGSPGPPWL